MYDNIILVGTGHILEKSVREVEEAIEREKPDVVAVELCAARYDALMGKVGEFSVKDVIAGGKPFLMLTHWLLAYVQRKMGNELGVEPGADMMAAIKKAEAIGCQIALVDRPIQITMQRFWKKMKFMEKLKMLFSIIFAISQMGHEKDDRDEGLLTNKGGAIDLDRITDEDVVTQLVKELRVFSPGAAIALLDERDAYIAGSLQELSQQSTSTINPTASFDMTGQGGSHPGERKIVAVVGAGHVAGIKNLLSHPELIPPKEEMCTVPGSRFNLSIKNLLGVGLGVALVIVLLAFFFSGISFDLLLRAFFWWFIITGVLSATGVVVARGHPFSALTAFFVAWLTTLNPFLAAGWFAGLVEAHMRNPTREDIKSMMYVESLRDLMNNKVFKVILVAALANVGATLGTLIGAYVVVHVVGIDINAIWMGLKSVL
ncbi:MAG: TraB/GumN family protein [Halobacteriota archaeon]